MNTKIIACSNCHGAGFGVDGAACPCGCPARANAGPPPGDYPMDRRIKAMPLPQYPIASPVVAGSADTPARSIAPRWSSGAPTADADKFILVMSKWRHAPIGLAEVSFADVVAFADAHTAQRVADALASQQAQIKHIYYERDLARQHARANHEINIQLMAAEMKAVERAEKAEAHAKGLEAEDLAMHRKLAAETLRADQGWARYEEANSKANQLMTERAALAQVTPVRPSSTDKFEGMFLDACSDLGLINEALGLDPDDGGAEPILEAIEELRAQAAAAPVQSAMPALPDVPRSALEQRFFKELSFDQRRAFLQALGGHTDALMAEVRTHSAERLLLKHLFAGAAQPVVAPDAQHRTADGHLIPPADHVGVGNSTDHAPSRNEPAQHAAVQMDDKEAHKILLALQSHMEQWPGLQSTKPNNEAHSGECLRFIIARITVAPPTSGAA